MFRSRPFWVIPRSDELRANRQDWLLLVGGAALVFVLILVLALLAFLVFLVLLVFLVFVAGSSGRFSIGRLVLPDRQRAQQHAQRHQFRDRLHSRVGLLCGLLVGRLGPPLDSEEL